MLNLQGKSEQIHPEQLTDALIRAKKPFTTKPIEDANQSELTEEMETKKTGSFLEQALYVNEARKAGRSR